VGGVAVDQHGGQNGRLPEAERAQMSSDQFDFTEGQSGGGDDVVDAGFGEYFRSGLGAGTGHVST
jgi:hypothetical protein